MLTQSPFKYSRDLNSKHLNRGNIEIVNFDLLDLDRISWLILVLEKCRPRTEKCFMSIIASKNVEGRANVCPLIDFLVFR